jgi:hypothetical protein
VQNTDQTPEENAIQTVDSENRYPIETEEEPTAERNWPMLLALAIAAIALLTLLFFAGRWVYHEVHHTSKVKPTPVITKKPSELAPASGKSSTSGTPPTPGTQSSDGSGQLPNTGPANVIAIFLASSFAAASLHYVVALRKQT